MVADENTDLRQRRDVKVDGEEANREEGITRICVDTPPFTLKDLKNAIPAHCFERSFIKSTLYLAGDLVIVAFLYACSTQFNHPSLPSFAPYLLWPVYWICQGSFSFAVWIIAHECGHYSYCESKRVCDIIGLIFHTILLVPYHSWRISHSKHHRNTNRMDGDEAFVPCRREKLEKEEGILHSQRSILARLIHLIQYLVIGWPGYLIFHTRGRDYKQHVDHFNPNLPLFNHGEYWNIVISDVALVIWLVVLGYFISIFGLKWFFLSYFIPYLVVNMWLVIITYLQHSDPAIPHYDDNEWTWLRGALCTVDRDYGVFNYIFHHLTDRHVIHHLFSHMPHYHFVEATEAIKPILGKYYNYDSTPVWKALWKVETRCRFVEDVGDILWYKSLSNE